MTVKAGAMCKSRKLCDITQFAGRSLTFQMESVNISTTIEKIFYFLSISIVQMYHFYKFSNQLVNIS